MWVKIFHNGTVVIEDRDKDITWCRTPLDNIIELYMISSSGKKSESLCGPGAYWHSRAAIIDPMTGEKTDILERIQKKIDHNTWETITWDGSAFIRSIEPKAYGRPVGLNYE